MSATPVSVIVLTYNEQPNLARCLESVAGWAGEVFVVDSFSTDRTEEIARGLGAHVVQHAFEGYAAQRNWALQHLPCSHEWVLFLDADEWLSGPLKEEIALRLLAPGDIAGFFMPRRHRFLGRWLRFGGLYPTFLLRLFRRDRGRCEMRLVDEHFVVSGPTAVLRHDLLTEDQRGIGVWIDRHNRYAELEARELLWGRGENDRLQPRLLGTQVERKRWIRQRVWNRLPLYTRPFLLFGYRYVGRLGFLDGRAGFIYHLLESFWYRLLIDLCYAELRTSQRHGEAQAEPGLTRLEETRPR